MIECNFTPEKANNATIIDKEFVRITIYVKILN